VIYKTFDIVVVPFPFTDKNVRKRRPALVLSQDTTFGKIIKHSVLAMITSQKNKPWPLDTIITGKKESGLTADSLVRLKLFTLDNRLILRKIGHLSNFDETKVKENLSNLL